MARKGKIARLPDAIREMINERIRDGIPFEVIAGEINARPEVTEALQPHFKNPTIMVGNLSEWKLGGFQEWQAEKTKAKAAQTPTERILGATQNFIDVAQGRLSDRIALLFASHMVAEIKSLEQATGTEEKARLWRELRMSLAAMKRYEFFSLRHKQELQKMEKQKAEEGDALTIEEKEARINEIMGLDEDQTYKDFLTATWRGPDAEKMDSQDDRMIAEGKMRPREEQIARYRRQLEEEKKRRESEQ